jgi:hypothetical protein
MKLVSVALCFSLLLMGCSSSYVVSSSPKSDPSFSAFNSTAEGRSGTVVLQDGREIGAQNIIASPDSILYQNVETRAIAVVPTNTVKKVVLTNHLTGALDGFGWGAACGAVIVMILSAVSPSSGGEFSGTAYAVFFMAIGAGAGGVIGAIPGALIGHSSEYQFVSGADGTTIK